MRNLSGFLFLFLLLISCNDTSKKTTQTLGTSDLNFANRKLLDIAMEDGFPPPVASRVYVYPHIAHYIALQSFYPDSLPDLRSRLNGLPEIIFPEKENANPELTALLSFCNTAKKVVFSEHYVNDLTEKFISMAKSKQITDEQIKASEKYAEEITQQLGKWLAKDNYIETRTMDRYTSSKKAGEWTETPPDYTIGLEPHWMKIRPLMIDSVSIYKTPGPPSYDASKNSPFYKMVIEVYEESKKLDSVKKEIALYWDDNPNVSEHKGHLVTMTHKISPPGHWLNIIDQVTTREKSSLFKTTKAYTVSSIAMFDAFLSCWYEKYKTNLVRPITYIRENIDINWKTLIQTPPFPEYTSAHSATSAAAATVLTNVFGENYSFADSTEILFNMPIRKFSSFHDAAWEVSLSRFYGGIHYKMSVAEGNKQGKFIGSVILTKIQ